jgi:hypothetical protein
MKRALLSLIVIAACGSKKSEPVAEQHEGHDEHGEMANMPPEIAKFHDVLAPRWHADKGDKRMKDTCAAIPDFTAGVTAIAKATPPAGADGAAWTDGAGKLAAAIVALDDTCKKNDATGFETAFQGVHESFHGLMALAMGEKHDAKQHAM